MSKRLSAWKNVKAESLFLPYILYNEYKNTFSIFIRHSYSF